MAQFGVTETVARVYEALEGIAADDADNDYALLWMVDGLVSPIEQLASYVRFSNDRDGWANTMDAATVVDDAIAWLGQFVGVAVDPNSRIDPRDQLVKHVRFNRGSVPGIRDYIESFMLPGKRPEILERIRITGGVETDGLPWDYTILVRHDDVASARYVDLALNEPTYAALAAAAPTYGDIPAGIPQLQQAVQASKPGGDLAWFFFAPGDSIYRDLNPGDPDTGMPFPTYADLAAALPTYADVDSYTPP